MPDEDVDKMSIFELRGEIYRDARYERATKMLKSLASKNRKMVLVIKILNRLGSVDDDGFQDLTNRKGKYRSKDEGVGYSRQMNGKTEMSYGLTGGDNLSGFMESFGRCLDLLVEEKKYSPEIIAAFATLMLGDIHPFVEGTGRTSRLLLNYVLIKMDRSPKNLDDELIEVRSTHHLIIDYEIDPAKNFGRTIFEFSQLNDDQIWGTAINTPDGSYFKGKQVLLDAYVGMANLGEIEEIPKVVEMAEIIRDLPEYDYNK